MYIYIKKSINKSINKTINNKQKSKMLNQTFYLIFRWQVYGYIHRWQRSGQILLKKIFWELKKKMAWKWWPENRAFRKWYQFINKSLHKLLKIVAKICCFKVIKMQFATDLRIIIFTHNYYETSVSNFYINLIIY